MKFHHKVRESVCKLMVESGAILAAPAGKPFTLASGGQSPYYVDCRKLLLTPEGIKNVGRYLFEHVTRHLVPEADYRSDAWLKKPQRPVVYYGGQGVGGMLLTQAVVRASFNAYYTLCPSLGFVIRDQVKDHGTGKRLEGHFDPVRGRICLLEDVITSGRSVLTAAATLYKETGRRPDVVACILDRQEGGLDTVWEQGYECYALLGMAELTAYAGKRGDR